MEDGKGSYAATRSLEGRNSQGGHRDSHLDLDSCVWVCGLVPFAITSMLTKLGYINS